MIKPLKSLLIILFCAFNVALADVSPNIFQIKDVWKDANGKSVVLSEFGGKKVVFAMVYTSCQSACPLITKKMKKIEAELNASKTNAEFVIVSFDSERDNAERLKHFQMHMDLAGEHWHLLSGSEKSTRKIANLLDIKFSKRPGSNEIMHDNKIILIDESGKVIRVLEGLKTDKMELF